MIYRKGSRFINSEGSEDGSVIHETPQVDRPTSQDALKLDLPNCAHGIVIQRARSFGNSRNPGPPRGLGGGGISKRGMRPFVELHGGLVVSAAFG
jgi:hypothetical protein